ncbi:sideroflexin-2 isoform X2 [Dryobates pubescens]|uniref:sideroflexin-2 isoform X2 n=1 Tax=Dryobates pubescens TaxID=118200 RepID=UPI0023BA0372|nr:sideroflexin-2 isoform X2 [Dryobates pubescens]
MATVPLGFNIDIPRWDQSTFMGRLKHFFNITDPRTVLVPEKELDQAKAMVESCRAGLVPPGSTQEQLLYAKKLYDSAFHPDSGEKMNLIGRMSFQVPGGMALTGCMLQFYRTVPAVVFWQWVNQSFNAIVNYTNRNAASTISLRQLGVAYITATGTALATAVGLNLYTKRAPPLLARWVPFAAVAAANCVNIPLMRQHHALKMAASAGLGTVKPWGQDWGQLGQLYQHSTGDPLGTPLCPLSWPHSFLTILAPTDDCLSPPEKSSTGSQ